MKELSLHILDIAENSVNARAKNIKIEIEESTLENTLMMKVEDDGVGMDAEMLELVTDPFITSRTERKVGLGLPFLKAAAEACNGSLIIDSASGKGTTITTLFQLDHIDRMPLGDIEDTFLHLLIGNPGIHWLFYYKYNEKEFVFDDEDIKIILDDLPLSNPKVIHFLKNELLTGISAIKN